MADPCTAGFQPLLCAVRVNRDRVGRSYTIAHVRFVPKADARSKPDQRLKA